jgi:pimeloyl-ACP methyl ester carboxylesterase
MSQALLRLLLQPLLAVAFLFSAMLISGCSTIGQAGAGTNAIHTETVFSETLGSDFELYSLDIGPEPRTALFFVTGSGCASLSHYFQSYFEGLVGSWKVYAVQKAGINKHDMGLICNQKFNDHNYFENLKFRNEIALTEVLRRHGGVAGIIGVSEGGQIAAELMHTNKLACSLVVIGSGGLPFRSIGTLLDTRRRNETFTKAFTQVATAPNSTTQKILGFTYKYWASFIDRDPAPAYLSLDRPIFMIFGSQDESVPVESARWLAQEFNIKEKKNFRLLELPEANHVLKQNGKNRKPEVMSIVASFLQKNQICTSSLL